MKNPAEQQERKRKEIAKWERQLATKPYHGYMAVLVVIVALIHLLDEYASSASGAIQSSIINDLFVGQMGVDYTTGLSMMSLITLITLFATIFSSVFKSLADRYGRKPFLVFSAFGMGFGMLLCAVAPNAPLYFAGRAVVGFFTATDFQVLYIMEVSPDDKRGIFYSVTKSIGTVGIVLIAVVRGAFLSVDAGNWRMIYMIPAVAGLVLGLITLLTSRETDVFMKRRIEMLRHELDASTDEQKKVEKEDKGGMMVALRTILRHSQLRNQLIAACLFMCAMMPFTGYYESIMTMGGMTTDSVTQALFFYPIAWAVLLFISGFVSDRMGRKVAVMIFGILAILCQIGFVLGASGGMPPVLVGLFLGGAIGCYWTSSNTISLMTNEIAPTHLRASISSVTAIVVLIVTLFATAFYAWLVTVISLQNLCLFGAIIALVLSMLFLAFSTKETAGIELDSQIRR
ncbi:MAG: MFS transporter [Eubacteriales bacterium]|nr:MFS transporter [Eubacteriales bacterium]